MKKTKKKFFLQTLGFQLKKKTLRLSLFASFSHFRFVVVVACISL